MNRSTYFDYCANKLSALATKIEVCGKLNLLHAHVHSESFYLHLMNMLFNHNLVNANSERQNVEGLDLIDGAKRLAVQVSATATKAKIESALARDYKDHEVDQFQFIAISKDASSLRKKIYKNSSGLKFSPSSDIHDISSLLNVILVLAIPDQKRIYEFIKDELGGDIDVVKLRSNLTLMIVELANSAPEHGLPATINPFEIQKKISYNNLSGSKFIIDEHAPYYARVEAIYSEFDKAGVNKSRSVFNTIQKIYAEKSLTESGSALFLATIDGVMNKVKESANFDLSLMNEELELSATVLVVHAFIRCKVFDHPPEAFDAVA